MSGLGNLRRRAAKVGGAVTLLDVRLRKVDAELKMPAAEPPFHLSIEISPGLNLSNDVMAYDIDYRLRSTDEQGREVLTALIGLSLFYETVSEAEFEDADLLAFGQVSVVFTAHPYVREIAQNLTTRMGLPPLVLDVMQSPLDLEGSLSAAVD